jgi:hypothetical protein
MATAPAKHDSNFSPLAAIQEALGPAYEEILEWAVGPDWEDLDMRQWPARMKERVKFVIPDQEDVYQSFERLKGKWDKRQDNSQAAPPSAHQPGSAAAASTEELKTMAEATRHVVRPDAPAAPQGPMAAMGNGHRADQAAPRADSNAISPTLIEALMVARQRQRQAWGDTSEWLPERWVAVIGEQHGDIARVVNQGKSLRLLKEEVIHAIALLVAWADEALESV